MSSLFVRRPALYTVAMSQRIALFGGSFNPIHHGHLIIARAVAEQSELDRVIFLPSRRPPHKGEGELLDPRHRAEMVNIAIQGEPLFEFSDYDLIRQPPSYTIDTVAHFRRALGADVELFWIIGADSLSELTTWHRAAELVDSCRILTALRPGWDVIDWHPMKRTFPEEQVARLQADVVPSPRIGISSTQLRSRVAAGQSIRFFTPDAVCEYIRQQGCYA